MNNILDGIDSELSFINDAKAEMEAAIMVKLWENRVIIANSVIVVKCVIFWNKETKMLNRNYQEYFNNETVLFYKSKIELEPWKGWSDVNAPAWWRMYNNVKHHRMETDKVTQREYYKFANLENVLNALAALYIIEEYYVYSYDYAKGIEITGTMELNSHIANDEIDKRLERALAHTKSRKCCMKQWQDAGCYAGFMGQEFFKVSKLKKIMDVRGEHNN